MSNHGIHIDRPITVTLNGGILDGDTFELVPNGSVMPPMRLSYPWNDGTYGYWLNYECQTVPEWPMETIVYVFAGKERIRST